MNLFFSSLDLQAQKPDYKHRKETSMNKVAMVVGYIFLGLFGLCIIAAALEWLVWRFDTSTVYYPFPNPYYRQGQAPVIPVVPALPQPSAQVGAAPAWQAPAVQPQAPVGIAPVRGQVACVPRTLYLSGVNTATGLGGQARSAFIDFIERTGQKYGAWRDFHASPSSRQNIVCKTGLCVVYGTTHKTNTTGDFRPISGLFEHDDNGTDPNDGSGAAEVTGTINVGFVGSIVEICPN